MCWWAYNCDHVSLTYRGAGRRWHIWIFAAGLTEDDKDPKLRTFSAHVKYILIAIVSLHLVISILYSNPMMSSGTSNIGAINSVVIKSIAKFLQTGTPLFSHIRGCMITLQHVLLEYDVKLSPVGQL